MSDHQLPEPHKTPVWMSIAGGAVIIVLVVIAWTIGSAWLDQSWGVGY